MYQSETIIEVPFHDVDLMRVVWHGHYAKYFEIARCTLFDIIDYNVPQMEASGYAWPVIDMRVRYAHPITFQQKIRVIASLVEWENRLKVEYLIEDLATGKRLTKGYTVQVAVSLPSLEMQYVSPDILFQKLGLLA
jgi:acyl-CoA thioester hydrolase